MRYGRSKTAMDDVSMFTPASQLSMGAYTGDTLPDATGGGSFLGAYYPDPNLATVDASNNFVTDGGRTLRGLGQDFPYDDYFDVGYDAVGQPPADAALPPTAPGASGTWNWQGLMDKAPAVLRDLMLATSTADYQAKLNEINLARAKQGLQPLDPAQYGPSVRVAVAPQTMKIAGIGAGTFLAVAVGAGFLLTRGRRRRR